MNRRFNSTGRIRISRDAIDVRLIEELGGSPPKFEADLSSLSALKLPGTARVILEAFLRQSSMRFDFGSIESIRAPEDTTLTEIDRGEGIQFRVKVVDT